MLLEIPSAPFSPEALDGEQKHELSPLLTNDDIILKTLTVFNVQLKRWEPLGVEPLGVEPLGEEPEPRDPDPAPTLQRPRGPRARL